MTPHPESPNALWAALGYAIERGPRHSRIIRRPDGSVVEFPRTNDRHADEIAAARAELRRLRRLPIGEAECLAVQESLPL